MNLKDNHYSIGNLFHDHGHNHGHYHILVHIHDFGTILHSLQGMTQFQLDGTSDSSLIAHYFVQKQEDIKLVLNIL